MPGHLRAYAYGLAAVLLWSTAASAFKLALRFLDPAELQLCAVATAVAFLLVHAAATGKLRGASAWTPRMLLCSAVAGFLNPFAYYRVLFAAYRRLPAQEALVLNYLWPIVLALLAVPFLGQRLGPRSLGALALSFVGVIVIGTRGDLASLRFQDPVGIMLAAGSSVIWALYWILNVRDRRDGATKLLQSFLFGLCYLIIAHITGCGFRALPWKGLAGAFYVGLFEMGVTFALWLKALSLIDRTARISNLVFLSPCLSLVLVRFVLAEPIAPSTLAGLTLILTGIALQVTSRRSSPG
ncbi:DMT family transporter [Candidatus Fermentibacteria bacterium]|nr:DMT family transporter [Candidatus Fermentibacteria bacterium]